jgi:putative flippase GtrA
MTKTQKLISKIRRAKKAVVGTLTTLTAAVVTFVPDYADEYKVGVGAVAAIFSGILIYYSTNEE